MTYGNVFVMTPDDYEKWSEKNRRYNYDEVVITPDILAELMKGKLILVDVHEEFEVVVKFALKAEEDEQYE